MNKLLSAMTEVSNTHLTQNSDLTYSSTLNMLADMFAFGAAYRGRSDEDCILLFKNAFEQNETLALKCLFYLRDVRGGQGERRFFRVCYHWLANEHTEAARRNMQYLVEYGRWDDFYCLVNTSLETEMFEFLKYQLALDVSCQTPSLLAKWLKSENCASADSRALGAKTRKAFGMTSKQYRKTLSILRERIRVLERLMSQNRWEEIEFDKIPSKAGLKYRNAFARRDILKARYEAFAKDKNTKVNAGVLNPCDVVAQARKEYNVSIDTASRVMVNKYWDNLTDYFKGAVFDGVAVVDTSGSMTWGYNNTIKPIDVAIALGMYCGEKCGLDSPWYNNYITFSRQARLVPIKGVDFVDKVRRIEDANLCENTNIESVFDLILSLAVKNNVPDSEMPKNIVIISDMEFDTATDSWFDDFGLLAVMEKCMEKYACAGYTLPHLVFWNVNAMQDNIPMRDNGNVTFVSGYSSVLFEQIMAGKTGLDLILEKLNGERYAPII